MKKRNTKQKILDALEGKKRLLCPSCKQDYFIRKTYDRVHIFHIKSELKNEIIEHNFEDEVYICQNCDEEISPEELFEEEI